MEKISANAEVTFMRYPEWEDNLGLMSATASDDMTYGENHRTWGSIHIWGQWSSFNHTWFIGP
jgi:hypothetical protein